MKSIIILSSIALMALSALAAPTSPSAPLTKRDGFQINYYSDTSCANFQGSWTGSNSNTDGTNFDVNGYIGGMIVVQQDTWTDTISDGDNGAGETIWYGGLCGASSIYPEAKYLGSEVGCMSIDKNLVKVDIGFMVCDAAGFDNQY